MAVRGLDRHDKARECSVEETARGICSAADGSRDRRGAARVHGETQGGIPRLERLNMAENITRSIRTGGCMCGAVRYRVDGPLRSIVVCHCEQCRRMTGHVLAATAAKRGTFELE